MLRTILWSLPVFFPLFGCDARTFGEPASSLNSISTGLFFAEDPESPNDWQLWWQGEPDQVLRYRSVRFEQQQLDSVAFAPIDPERYRRSRRSRTSCSHYQAEVREQEQDIVELRGAGVLAQLSRASLEPGQFRVVVDRVDDESLLAEFAVDGLNRSDVRRFDARIAEVKAGACRDQPYRVDSLQGAFMSRLDPGTLVELFEDRSLWPSSTSAAEDHDFLQELAVRDATTNVFGSLVVESSASPEALWELARDVHQPFFIAWLAPRLDPNAEPNHFEQRILERGAWSAEVMDYVSMRIELLRQSDDTHKQLLELARLLQVAPNEFDLFYPEQAEWIQSEFHIGFGFACRSSFSRACGFAHRIPECEQALNELMSEYELDGATLPTLRASTDAERILGI